MIAVRSWDESEYDELWWKFLHSELSGGTYANWPVERRLDAYLRHHDLPNLRNDGSAYHRLLDSVMENIGPAHRRGIHARGIEEAVAHLADLGPQGGAFADGPARKDGE